MHRWLGRGALLTDGGDWCARAVGGRTVVDMCRCSALIAGLDTLQYRLGYGTRCFRCRGEIGIGSEACGFGHFGLGRMIIFGRIKVLSDETHVIPEIATTSEVLGAIAAGKGGVLLRPRCRYRAAAVVMIERTSTIGAAFPDTRWVDRCGRSRVQRCCGHRRSSRIPKPCILPTFRHSA